MLANVKRQFMSLLPYSPSTSLPQEQQEKDSTFLACLICDIICQSTVLANMCCFKQGKSIVYKRVD